MKIKSAIVASTIGAIMLFGGQALAAGTASLSLGGGSFVSGNSFAVPVYVNSGVDPVNVVQADFNYDASAMQFQGVSCGGAFGITAGAGANSVTCGVSGGASVTGNQLVATINFRALASSGSSVANIASSSHVYRSTDNTDVWNGVATSAGFSFTSPAPAPSKPARTTTSTTPVSAPTTAPVTPTPVNKTTKKSIVNHARNAVAVKSSSNGVYWALIVLGVVTLFFLLPAAWLNRHPKQSRIYKRNTKRFIQNNITNPSKRIYKHGVQFNPFAK